MRRRLYFLVNDLPKAQALFDKLLLSRISDEHIHVLAKEGVDVGDLPEATTFQRSDFVHSLFVGLGLGAIVGIIAGFIGHGALNAPLGGVMLATTIIGAIIGAWSATMIGIMVPNRHLNNFYPEIAKGKILIIVDVPMNKINEIKELVQKQVPKAAFAGIEPTLPRIP